MTVYPFRTPPTHPFSSDLDDELSVLPAWLVAIVLLTFFALIALSSIEPFHYEGVGRHLTVTALFGLYILGWKEVFRRFVGR